MAHEQNVRANPVGHTSGPSRSTSIKSIDTSDEWEMLALSPQTSPLEEIKPFNTDLEQGMGLKKTSNTSPQLAIPGKHTQQDSRITSSGAEHAKSSQATTCRTYAQDSQVTQKLGLKLFAKGLIREMLMRNALKIGNEKEKRGTQWTWNTREEVQKMLAEID